MKKTVILSIILCLVLLVGLLIGAKMIVDSQEDKSPVKETYEIIVDDTVKVYCGEENSIAPYLIRSDGSAINSRFKYECSSPEISISNEDGKITFSSIPKGDITVKITELNTGVEKTVKLQIIDTLEAVLGVIAPDGSLVEGKQSLTVGQTYAITITTKPVHKSIEDYCTVVAKDADGNEKNVFKIEFDNDKVLLTVLGIGEGTVSFRVVNDKNQEIHQSYIAFESSLEDDVLTSYILNEAGKSLLSKEEVSEIRSIKIDGEIKDLAGLEFMPSLETIFVLGSTIFEFESIPSKYIYRVSEALFYSYYSNDAWAQARNKLIPYDAEMGGEYIIYHSEKSVEISFKKLYDGYALEVYELTGYVNEGWTDEEKNVLTNESISSLEGSVHAYAVWRPVMFTVEYHVRDFDVIESDSWDYETNKPFREMTDFAQSIKRTGYRFAGWTDNANTSVYSDYVKYKAKESYEKISATDGSKVILYDIWEPIEYQIEYDVLYSEAVKLDNSSARYGKEYNLPTAACPGYNFSHWKTEDGRVFYAGKNEESLSDTDGAIVRLSAVYTEIKYTIVFHLDGGKATSAPDFVDGVSVELSYNQTYVIPSLTRDGYTTYVWECDGNNELYAGGAKLYREFTADCKVNFYAKWTAAQYTVTYVGNGGSVDGVVNRCWDDQKSLSEPTRTGYTFGGWKDIATGEILTKDSAKWNGNLIANASENGKRFELHAQWKPNVYTVTFKNASVTPGTLPVTFASAYGNLPSAGKVGHNFVGWKDKFGKMVNSSTIVTIADNHDLEAVFTPITYTVYFDPNGGSVSSSYKYVTYGTQYGSLPTPTRSNSQGNGGYTEYTFSRWVHRDTGASIYSSTTMTTAGNHYLRAEWTSKWVETCLAEGTSITMEDGSVKNIEEIKVGDNILVWDFVTGKFSSQPVILMQGHETTTANATKLIFSDGTSVIMSYQHAFFDIDLLEFTFITEYNATAYIGHRFQKLEIDENGNATYKEVVLESVEISEMTIKWYNIATAGTLNHYANGILAGPANTEGVINIFEVGKDLKYDEQKMANDINQYGVYEYSEWSEHVTYEEFIAFNGAYFKIAIGKGMLTSEQLEEMIYNLKYVW